MMKNLYNLFAVSLLSFVFGITSANAQDVIDYINWEDDTHAVTVENAAVSGENVYLYNVNTKTFLSMGGTYGFNAFGTDACIPFTVEERGGYYYFKSPVKPLTTLTDFYLGLNKHSNITELKSTDVMVDATLGYSAWTAQKLDQSGKVVYNFLMGSAPLALMEGTLRATTATGNGNTEWAIVPRSKYLEVLNGIEAQTFIDITGYIKNSCFYNAYDRSMWEVESVNTRTWVGSKWDYISYGEKYGAYSCAEIGEGEATISQTISGLKPGLYAVEAQGFCYNDKNLATAYLFAKTATNTEQSAFSVISIADKAELEKNYNDFGFPAWILNINNNSRYNFPAGAVLASDSKFVVNESKYSRRIYIVLEEGQTDLTLGMKKTGYDGRAFMDNVKLYYCGHIQHFGVDAYNRNATNVDMAKYNYRRTFYLSRKFKLNTWEALVLPVDLTVAQVRSTFGDDVKLCQLIGLNPERDTQIMFEEINLDKNMFDHPAIKAGECYIVKVSKNPEHNTSDEFVFNKKDEADGKIEAVTFPYGYVYRFNGVNRPTELKSVTGTVGKNTATGNIEYTYFYYRPESAPANSYVVINDNMYHIPSAWDKLMGTCWYITVPTDEPLEGMVIANDGTVTDIEGVVTDLDNRTVINGVFNLNGQKVADDASKVQLPKGVYIVNGKKQMIR